MKIEYALENDHGGKIHLPPGPPFDGKPVLVHFAGGWCEAWWEEGRTVTTVNGDEAEGFQWICMDDDFQYELDDALEWLPLPDSLPYDEARALIEKAETHMGASEHSRMSHENACELLTMLKRIVQP